MSDTLATPWTVTHQAPLSMGFPRQEYWSGLPFPSPGNLPANAEDAGSIPGLEDPLEKEMATHSNILAWEIPWTEEPDGLQFLGSQKELDTT